MAETQGKTLGHFVVEGELGRGGMGVVMLARQPSLDRLAVLKKVRRDIADLPELAERFEREARAAAAVHHQNVVAVYDYFRWRSDQYIAQEYVDGLDLGAVLGRTGPLPWRIAAMIALGVARGLEELHSRGTIHRDLKPANILLGRRGEVKIADFGLALEATGVSLTQPGVMVGSLSYMPPEQMLGERVDGRGDLFSVGVVLFEMLSGVSPYPESTEDDTDSLLLRMQKERHPRLRRLAKGVPRSITRLVRSCMRGKVRRRIASVTALRRSLERDLGRPSPADCAVELAAWLWERQVFDKRDNETVVRVGGSLPSAPFRVRRSIAFAAAAALLLAALGLAALHPELAGFREELRMAELLFPY